MIKTGKKRRTSDWNIVITILQCDIVNVIRIHTVAAVRLILVLLCFLDATVHLRGLFPILNNLNSQPRVNLNCHVMT